MDSYFDDGYCLAADPLNPDVAYAGGAYYVSTGSVMAVCKSTDGGQTWGTRRALTARTGACRDLAVAPSDSQVVYAVGDETRYGKVFRSADAGSTWSEVTNDLATFHAGYWYVYAVRVHPTNVNRVLVGTNRGVFVSTNGGTSWSSTDLTNSTQALLYDETNDRVYAATTTNGVYRSRDDGDSWEQVNNGLGRLRCLCLGLDPMNGYLFVGTDGGGIWRTLIARPLEIETWRHY